MMIERQRGNGMENLANCAPDTSSCANEKALQRATVSERMMILREMAAEAEGRARELEHSLYGNRKEEEAQPEWEPGSLDETVDWIAEKMRSMLRIMREVRERL